MRAKQRVAKKPGKFAGFAGKAASKFTGSLGNLIVI
jgi:hypothetical protein